MTARYRQLCDDFAEVYQTLESIKCGKETRESHEILNNYIPAYKILYGYTNDVTEQASVYVWTPDDKEGQTFDQYLEYIKENPNQSPATKIFNTIKVITTITDGIKALHTAGLLHLDIKPSNFLALHDSNLEINPYAISMFDLNTLYKVDSDYKTIAGTLGYRAPEVARGEADNRSDIYAIGAMLFNALIIIDGLENEPYCDAYYKNIDDFVKSSKLLNNSEYSQNIYFRTKLSHILKMALNPNADNRYSCCEYVIEDLENLSIQLLPSVHNQSLTSSYQTLAFIDKEPEHINVTTRLQNLLYHKPLLDWVPEKVHTIDVLVIGAGTYAQKFIDLVLQAAQVPNYTLNITAITEKPSDHEAMYIQFRKGISNFVNINGKWQNHEKTPFANLNFKSISTEKEHFSKEDAEMNQQIIDELMKCHRTQPFQYILVALGDDQLNGSIANSYARKAKASKVNCSVNYLISDEVYVSRDKTNRGKPSPIRIYEPITPSSIDPELERMAFNTHLSWANSRCVDLQAEYKTFKEKYNYESSMSFAMGIRYKLKSLGIDYQRHKDLSDLAKAYANAIKVPSIFSEMVKYEHRRWVIEKVVDGWDAPRNPHGEIDFNYCVVNGSVKDHLKKLHPCLVDCSEKMPLSRADYAENNQAKWDDPEIDAALDELDHVSIGLHQCFKTYAEQRLALRDSYQKDLLVIEELVQNVGENIIIAYNHYTSCLEHIINGNRAYTERFSYFHNELINAITPMAKEDQDEIKLRLEQIKRYFFPIIERNLYRNYKAYDEILVRKIPFILTYQTKTHLALALYDGYDSDITINTNLKNITSAMMINPQKISFTYYFDKPQRLTTLVKTLSAISSFMKRKNMHMEIGLLVAVCDKLIAEAQNDLYSNLELLKTKISGFDYECIICNDEIDAIKKIVPLLFERMIDYYDGSTDLFQMSRHNQQYKKAIKEKLPYFEFDVSNKAFRKITRCENLAYIEDHSFISVDDLSIRSGQFTCESRPLEYALDYEKLWDVYSGHYCLKGSKEAFFQSINAWHHLCGVLKNFSDQNDLVLALTIGPIEAPRLSETNLFLPSYTYKGVKKLISSLIDAGVLFEGSKVRRYTSDTSKIKLIMDESYQQACQILFSDPTRFIDERLINIQKKHSESEKRLLIWYNDLKVDKIIIEPSEQEILEKLKEMAELSFINALEIDEIQSTASFVYSSERIKRIMTQPDEMLKIYTYYEVLKTGYFDDVAIDQHLMRLTDTNKESDDMVVTKGFASMHIDFSHLKNMLISSPEAILKIGETLKLKMEN
nr:hypothetical protein [Fusibacter paucivorans]